jgi:UDP-3-O-[3-hydroxymyristoyl] glucosamine N-acyltransferase
VGARAQIGEGAIVYGRSHIGERVVIGPLSVIGRPGFGFTTSPSGEVVRIPQLGGVVIEADAEIGPLCTIDAGTLSPTIVRRGVKLDAHVHVAHNVDLGAGTIVAAQSGFAGSARIGSGVLVGGQAGVKDHATVGAGARIAAKSGVIGDVAPGAVVAGFPAVPRIRWLRAWAKLLGSGKRSD